MKTSCRESLQNAKPFFGAMSRNEKREQRRTGDEGFYIPPAARLRTLFFRFAPSKRTQTLPDRRALLLTSPAFSAIRPANPACPGVAERSLRCPSQVPFAAPCRRRYNTLDLASKIVCQGSAAPFGYPRHETARFLWILPHRESRSIPIVPRPSLPKGELPLWTPRVRGTLFPLISLATKPSGFIGCFPSEKNQHDNRDAHSAFSLPKGTGPL